jgi:chitinase
VSSWVDNAVSSLLKIIKDYHLDGIDIDYEHFQEDNHTIFECIGQLITKLKQNNAISFASIAPFDDQEAQSHYLSLWNKYGDAIDCVNFQFYAYDASTTISEFIQYYNT